MMMTIDLLYRAAARSLLQPVAVPLGPEALLRDKPDATISAPGICGVDVADCAGLADLLEAQIVTVNRLAAGLVQSGLNTSGVAEIVARLVETVLSGVVGTEIDADQAGLKARIGHELARLDSDLTTATLHISPADLAILSPTWSAPPRLAADPAFASGSYRISVGEVVVADTLADRLAASLSQLRTP